MKKILAFMALAAMAVGLLAAPAAADVNGVAAFTGDAKVGSTFVSGCPKTGKATIVGNGLGILPGQYKNAVYQITTSFTAAGAHRGDVGPYSGTFNLCGWLTTPLNLPKDIVPPPAGPIGGSCLSTKSQGGRGEAEGTNIVTGHSWKIKLFNIGWKMSAGPIIPVTGDYQEYDGIGPAKKTKFGTIYSYVGVFPVLADGSPDPLGCLSKAANIFRVVGGAVLLNDGATNDPDFAKPGPLAPNPFEPKKCVGEPDGSDPGTDGDCPVGPGK